MCGDFAGIDCSESMGIDLGKQITHGDGDSTACITGRSEPELNKKRKTSASVFLQRSSCLSSHITGLNVSCSSLRIARTIRAPQRKPMVK